MSEIDFKSCKKFLAAHPVLGVALAIWLVCTVLALVFINEPSIDIANYYGRLAREFGQGNWDKAFFHMIPPLIPALAGVLVFLGLPAFTALKLISCLFFGAALIPLYRLMRRLMPARMAEFACLLFIVNPRLLRYSTMGLLTAAKVFFLLLIVDQAAAYRAKRSYRALTWVALGLAGLGLTRGEGLLFLLPVVGVLLLGDWLVAGKGTGRSMAAGVRAAAFVTVVCLVVWSPWVWYQVETCGVPCLDSRQARKVLSLAEDFGIVDAQQPPRVFPADVVVRPADRPEDRHSQWRNLREAFKGFVPAYLLLAFIGVGRRIRNRTWTGLDWAFSAVILYNVLIFQAQGFITKRYTSATIPFILCWTVLGAEWVLLQVRRLPVNREKAAALIRITCGLFVTVCVWDGLSKVRPSLPLEPDTQKQFAAWVRENRAELDVRDCPELQSSTWGGEYYTGRQPVIATTDPRFAFRSGAGLYLLQSKWRYSYDALVKVCQENNVDVLLTTDYFSRVCPDFQSYHPHFKELETPDWPAKVSVYAFTPEAEKLARTGISESTAR